MLSVKSGLFSLRPVALRVPRWFFPLPVKLRCTPASVTCQVFSTLAPSMGFSPSEFVLVVSRFSFQSCLPFFLLASALSPRVDVHVAVFASIAVRA